MQTSSRCVPGRDAHQQLKQEKHKQMERFEQRPASTSTCEQAANTSYVDFTCFCKSLHLRSSSPQSAMGLFRVLLFGPAREEWSHGSSESLNTCDIEKGFMSVG